MLPAGVWVMSVTPIAWLPLASDDAQIPSARSLVTV